MKFVKLSKKKKNNKEMMKNNKKMEHKSYLYCKVIKTHKDINVSAS